MTRIPSEPGSTENPQIERASVLEFFEARARKISTLGPVRAVIYQDKHPDLAEKRDAAEKASLLPRLELKGAERLLDLGCGTGRWAKSLLPLVAHYHGADASEGLVEFARQEFAGTRAKFTAISAEKVSLRSLGEELPFDRIFCAGLLIYLNDDELAETLTAMASVAAKSCRILLREPVGVSERLTLKRHFSEELEQEYNAIYRTERELGAAISEQLEPHGFHLVGSGDVFSDASLNNRAETRQKWLLVERAE